jgi:prepilin-type N-terminal cleavage/methylation domain-containing protein
MGEDRCPRQPIRHLAANRSIARTSRGFTLIEILIVISIIALLSSFVLVAITRGKQGAAEAMATQMVAQITGALERYVTDEGEYPAMTEKADPDRNDFPTLFDALLGDPRPHGPGGRSAPYLQIKEDQIAVYDEDLDQYRAAEKEERLSPKVKKYILDSWGQPYVYRCNKGKKRESWMHRADADIYSIGPNEQDDTALESEKSDDIGNW